MSKNSQLYDAILAVFNKYPEKVGISSPLYGEFSYKKIMQLTAQMANVLKSLGLKPGDVLAAQIEKSVQNIILYLACLQSNIIYLPLNPHYTPNELNYFINDAKPRLFVCDSSKKKIIASLNTREFNIQTLDSNESGSLVELCQAQEDVFNPLSTQGNDIAAILYTSGTTGKPKGAMLTQACMYKNALAINEAWALNESDVILHVLPLFHAHGLFFAFHTALLAGATLIWLPKFDPRTIITNISKSTVFMGIPTFYSRLLKIAHFNKDLCKNIRLFTSGSAPLLTSTFEQFKKVIGCEIVERYGMTETGINASNPLYVEKKAGTVGKALNGINVRIVDDEERLLKVGLLGKIQIKGDNLFKGYLNLPDKTSQAFTKEGYFRTGDLGFLDKDNYLIIVGRESDLIISGGLNIYPKEIELVIDAMVGVVESAVFGVPHPDYVESVIAVVIKEEGALELNEGDILQYLRKNLAHFKIPKKIFFEETLPRNAMGKVQKKDLKAKYENIF